MINSIDSIIIIFYLIATLAVGIYTGSGVKTMRDYAIGDKKFSTLVIIMTICATVIEGSDILSATTEIFTIGILFVIACTGSFFNNLAVAKFIAPKMGKFSNMLSGGEILGTYYGKSVRVFTGISGFLLCLGFVATQIKAMSIVLTFFLEIHPLQSLLASSFIVIIYTAFGGVRSVTTTDVLQFITIAIALPFICFMSLKNVGGFSGILENVPATHFDLNPSNFITFKYLSIFIAYSIPFLSPPIMQRILMAKDTKQIKDSFKISAFVMLIFVLLIAVIGFSAFALRPDMDPQFSFLYLVNTTIPTGLKGIAIIGVLAIIMSSADSFMNSGSVSLVHDAIKPMMGYKMPDHVELYITKFVTITIGLSAILMALEFDNLIELMLYSYNLWGPVVVVPLMMIIFGRRYSIFACQMAMFAGISSVASWKYFGYEEATGVDSIIPSLLINYLTLVISDYVYKAISGNYNYETHTESF